MIAYLREVKQPAILACTIRGKQGGTHPLCRGRKSYRTSYTFTDGTTVDMAVLATLAPDKQKKRRRQWLLCVVLGLDWKPHTVCRRYRDRFGIESSFRILHRVRIKTTARNPAFRFFVLGFALLLVNLWAFLPWFVARVPGRGPHRIHPVRFQFHAFVSLLKRAIEERLGGVMAIPSSTPLIQNRELLNVDHRRRTHLQRLGYEAVTPPLRRQQQNPRPRQHPCRGHAFAQERLQERALFLR